MKRFGLVLAVVGLLAQPATAQIPDITSFKGMIEEFGLTLAPALPMNASVGGTWSEAWMGDLFKGPGHIGVGTTVGVTFIPAEGLNNLLDSIVPNLTLPPEVEALGVPIPVAVVDAKIGGLILPFDVGIKYGFLPPAGQAFLATAAKDFTMDYRMIGADVRYALIKENFILPTVSLGAGFTRLDTSMSLNPFTGDPQMDGVPYDDGNGGLAQDGTLTLVNPRLNVNWATNVIDLKAQVSKNFLIVTPYAGAGASVGISEAGGGINADLSLSAPSHISQTSYTGQAVVDLVNAARGLPGFPQDLPELTADGISSTTTFNGWAYRLYGGASLNLWVFKLDLQAQYNVADGTLGANLGARFVF